MELILKTKFFFLSRELRIKPRHTYFRANLCSRVIVLKYNEQTYAMMSEQIPCTNKVKVCSITFFIWICFSLSSLLCLVLVDICCYLSFISLHNSFISEKLFTFSWAPYRHQSLKNIYIFRSPLCFYKWNITKLLKNVQKVDNFIRNICSVKFF